MKIGKASLMGAWLFGAATYVLASHGAPGSLLFAEEELIASAGASWEASEGKKEEIFLAALKSEARRSERSPADAEGKEEHPAAALTLASNSAKASASQAAEGKIGMVPRRVGSRIAQAYRVSPWVAKAYVQEAFDVGREVGVDPYLILAVMATESSFNPVAQSSVGAVGLMQVIPKWHPETGASEVGLTDGRANIKAGAIALKKFLRSSAGNVEMALLKYNGSAKDPKKKYAKKVLGRAATFKSWARDA